MTIDIFEYLTHIDQERYRAVILHAAPEKGLAMTQFAQKICVHSGGKYFDLLEFFIQNKELSEHIDSFSPEKFRSLLAEQSRGCTFLCIDRGDFLLDTWRKAERQAFFRMLDKQWDGFREGMRARLMFCLQTSQEIESLQITDSQGQPRIWRLSDFHDIA